MKNSTKITKMVTIFISFTGTHRDYERIMLKKYNKDENENFENRRMIRNLHEKLKIPYESLMANY